MAVQKPVFIVSTGRAGSQMVARLLARHDELYAVHEPRPYMSGEAFAAWKGTHDQEYIAESVRWKRSRLVRETAANALTYVESSHFCSHLIPVLHQLYEARFVHLYRDGRAFVRSGLEREWYPTSQWSEVLRASNIREEIKRYLRRHYFFEVGSLWDDHRLAPPRELRTRVEKITWLWVEINRSILSSLERLPEEARLEFRLEDIDGGAIRSLLGFIGVRAEGGMVEEMLEVASVRPNRTEERSVPAFTDWSYEDQDAFWRLAGPMMERLGYDVEV